MLAVMLGMLLPKAKAQPAAPQLQIFVRVEGSVPDWQAMTLTVTQVQIHGVDTTGKSFVVIAFQGSQQLVIPRAAAGSARFLVAGTSVAGQINQIFVTFGAMSLTTDPASAGTSPRVIPMVVSNNTVTFVPSQDLIVNAGGTGSVVATITLGGNAVLTTRGVLALRPTLAADLFTPTGENFLNGAETLEGGLHESLPELAVEIVRSKAVDPTSGAIRNVTVRADDGALVSFPDLRGQNEALWRTHHGALNPRLVEALGSLSPADQVLADVFLDAPGPQTLVTDAQTPEAWDVAHAAFVEERRNAAQPIVSDAAAALAAAGATILSTNLDPPVLHIQASRSVLETSVASVNGVVEVAGTPTKRATMATNAATDLVQQPLQLAHLLGAGQGLRIALMDFDPCIDTDHEALQGVYFEKSQFKSGCDPGAEVIDLGGTAEAGHSTAVAGALAGYSPGNTQGALNQTRPPAGLVGLFQGRMTIANDCNYPPFDLNPHLASSSCITYGPNGGPDTEDRRGFDYAVYAHRIFAANGSGDIGKEPLVGQYEQTAFCYSYNAVCVGGYFPNNTYGPDYFGDDFTTSADVLNFGGWANFQGREKPDLVGPYSAVLPDARPSSFPHQNWTQWGGTSFSAPFVTGTAALLMANFPQYLVNDPTLTRAVLMASASHSFAGAPPVPIYSDNIDDRAGAGAPRGDRAKEILEYEQFFTRFVDRSVDFNTAGDLTLSAPTQFRVHAGNKVRVILTYDQCQVDWISIADALMADLDMVARETHINGDPAIVHANNSSADNTEMLEFTTSPDTDSIITVNVHAQHWDACSDGTRKTHMAIAWDALP